MRYGRAGERNNWTHICAMGPKGLIAANILFIFTPILQLYRSQMLHSGGHPAATVVSTRDNKEKNAAEDI